MFHPYQQNYQFFNWMVFAGRSREIADVIKYSVKDRDIRIVIYSDGFEDFSRYCIKQSYCSGLADAFITFPVDQICEWMHRILVENAGLFEHDDIALIVLNPFQLSGTQADQVLIGGTQPHEEKIFRTEAENGNPDLWIPHHKWATAGAEFLQSGIKVIPDSV